MKHTSIEQSKRLLELGLKCDTADMRWVSNMDTSDREYLLSQGESEDWDVELVENCGCIGKYDIPCWSVDGLFDLMPAIGRFNPTMCKFDGAYHCDYFDEDGESMKHFISTESLLEACYQMMEWLLSSGLMNKI